jgi:uncharacterized protein (TIGR03083 family)
LLVDVRAAIAAERRRTADLIDSLNQAQLETPSLCGAWTVKEVAGHLVSAVDSPRSMLPRMVLRSGFRLHRANAMLAAEVAKRPAADLAGALRRHADHPFKPPLVGYAGPLTDLLVHGQDMRRPLGLAAALDPERLRFSLGWLTAGRAPGFTSRRRLAGLRFEATDLDWSWGAGPVLTGPGEALLMAITGRPAALRDLDGPGVGRLAARLR